MRVGRKLYAAVLTAAMAAGLFGMTSMAASKEKIKTIRLELTDNLTRGGAIDSDEVEFTTTSDQYEVIEWEFESNGIIWEENDIPRVTVRLETGDDYSFSVPKSGIKVKGDEATVYSTTREDSQTLLITFDLKPMSSRVGTVEYAYLNDSIATWPAGKWELIDSKWYFFNEGGYRVSGWVSFSELWYFLGPEGDMWINCQTPDGYTVNGDGVRVS